MGAENIDDPHFEVVCGDSAEIDVADGSFDLVLTDPPYHDDVHYGELSSPFRAWAGLPMDALEGEAVSNPTTEINSDRHSYAASLERIFRESRRVLRGDGRLVFSYANHAPEAWVSLFSALQSAGFHAVACVVVHAENETDFKKRDVNSCTDDVLLELSPDPTGAQGQAFWTESDPFLRMVLDLFVRVGSLEPEWEAGAIERLRAVRRQAALAASSA